MGIAINVFYIKQNQVSKVHQLLKSREKAVLPAERLCRSIKTSIDS